MLKSDGIPYHSPSAQAQKFDSEVVVYCQQRKKAIYLNETASLVWQLCDRTRTVADIVELISQNYPEQAEEVRGNVFEAIESLWLEGAIRVKHTAKD